MLIFQFQLDHWNRLPSKYLIHLLASPFALSLSLSLSLSQLPSSISHGARAEKDVRRVGAADSEVTCCQRRVVSTDINLPKLIRVGKPQFNIAPASAETKLSLSLSLSLCLASRNTHSPSLRFLPPLPACWLASLLQPRSIISLIRTRLAETAER